jgi:NAD kinase
MLPRAVLVERPTEYRDLLARHGTREQVRFFLQERGLALTEVEARHLAYEETRAGVLAAIPPDWRRSVVDRSELDRFLFAADDVVIALGQDGLVANVAKYLDGQPVIGLDPDPGRNAGVLVRHPPAAAADLLRDVAAGRAALQRRTMAEGRLDDGQRLLALNELFVGHVSHQSARYALELGGRREHQSSSGLIVATGTGATGWAASINGARVAPLPLPGPTDPVLACLVREAWPSAATGTELDGGLVAAPGRVTVTSELGDGGVVFGDGIEGDRLTLDWGRRITIGVAAEQLALVA